MMPGARAYFAFATAIAAGTTVGFFLVGKHFLAFWMTMAVVALGLLIAAAHLEDADDGGDA